MKRILFFVIMTCLGPSIGAQQNSSYGREDAYQDIRTLHNGALVVRLQGEKRKLDVLLEQATNAPAGKSGAYQDRIEEIESKRDSFNHNLIRAFRSSFQFCPVYFIYDHDARRFLSGEREAIFLDENGEVDPGILWKDHASYLGLRSGEAIGGPEGLIMTDASFQDIPDPFPGFVSKNSLGSVFNWILARDIYWRKNAERMVEKLDIRLTRFYIKQNNELSPLQQSSGTGK